jgi:transcriptional regulator with XRE-family HTH domain
MTASRASDSLFTLLAFCGLRQHEVADYLHVGKSQVSHWRSGFRSMPAKHHAALIALADRTYTRRFQQWLHAPKETRVPRDPAVMLQEYHEFCELLDAAKAERHPQVWFDRFDAEGTEVRLLAALMQQHKDDPDEVRTAARRMERLGHEIMTAARMLQTQLAVDERPTTKAPQANDLSGY